MITWLGAIVYYGMSYDRTVVWLYCRRTCNRTPSLVLSILCASIYKAIGILCHRFSCVWYAHRNAWDVQQREFMRIYFWYLPSTSLSCVSYIVCVFICSVHTRPAVLGRWGVGKLSYSVITAQLNSVYSIINTHPRNSVLHALWVVIQMIYHPW